MEAKKVDAKGRVLLPAELANSYVIIEKVSDYEYRLRTADVVPRGPKLLPKEERKRRLKNFLKRVDELAPEIGKAWESDLSAPDAVARQRR